MEYLFRFDYVAYNFEDKSYLQQDIKAENLREASIKFVAECNGLTFSDAQNLINTKMKSKVWSVKYAIDLSSPLGASGLSLYDIRNIKRIKQVISPAPLQVF